MILPLPKTDREKILYAALEKFRTDGFSKTTMDEISSLSGFSKNTLYKYFPSKEKLTEDVVETTVEYINACVQTILSTRENAITKFIKILHFIVNSVLRYNQNMLFDIKIHLPELWEKIDNLRTEYMYKNISKIIRQGKKEKLFCNCRNEIVIAVFMGAMRNIVDPEFINRINLSVNEAVDIAFTVIINGILTPKGKIIYKKLKKNNNDKID
jgi:AcrR family transcriptional regulator